jgi:hypothetical protein
MSGPQRSWAELDALLGALREGLATADQMARLDALIRSDPEARDYYLDYIEICSTLRHYQGSPGRGEWSGPLRPDPLKAQRRSWPARVRWEWPAVAATLLAVLSLGGLATYWRGSGAGSPAGDGAFAVLSRTVDAAWGPSDLPTEGGSALRQGRLILKAGLAQVEFYGGAILVIEGPADVELRGVERIFCRRGKVRVRASNQTAGLSVATPNAEVAHLGTDFGVRVGETGDLDVRVFEGEVEVRGSHTGKPSAAGRALTANQSVHLDASGDVRDGKAEAVPFVGTQEFDERWRAKVRDRHAAWLAMSRKLRADRRTLVYYTFERPDRSSHTLRDQVEGRGATTDGAIVDCQWSDGRWPDKPSLEFKRPSNRVRVNLPGKHRSLTLMAWVRVDAFDRALNSLLMSDGWNQLGKMHWQLDQEGHLKFGISQGPNYMSPTVLDARKLGVWTNLATVFDADAGRITHYVDGRRVGTLRIDTKAWVEIGPANLGNWDAPTGYESERLRNFNGRMDELVLFNQALSDDEIRTIYNAGKPES